MGLIEESWPFIRRAREYRLYDDRGKRYLDLFQNDGRAIMGHRPGKFSHHLKNALARGVWADYPSPMNSRLIKPLRKIFAQYSHITFFRNKERAETAMGQTAEDPLFAEDSSFYHWRPLMPEHREGDSLLVRLPIAGVFETAIVMSKNPLPQGDHLSPIILESLSRLFFDFIQWKKSNPAIRDFSSNPVVTQQGPYLIWEEIPREYEMIWLEALKKGLLLPPNSNNPLLIPMEMSDYEYKLLKEFLGGLS